MHGPLAPREQVILGSIAQDRSDGALMWLLTSKSLEEFSTHLMPELGGRCDPTEHQASG